MATNNISSNILFDQILKLFTGTVNPEGRNKTLLFIAGILLFPITMFGALLGFKQAYKKFYKPDEIPTLANLKPITKVSMIIWSILIWILLIGTMVVFVKLYGVFFSSKRPGLTPYIILGVNIIFSIIVFVNFRKWQNKTTAHILETGRFGSARWAYPDELNDLAHAEGIYIGGEIYAYGNQSHFLSCSSTRGGKGTNLIVPNLLGLGNYKGSFIVVDVKGENAAITARYRREIGHDVVILDPWNVNSKEKSGTYNPLDLVINCHDDNHRIDDVEMLSEMIISKSMTKEPFWENTARSWVAGLILHIVMTGSKDEKHLGTLWSWLRLPEEEFQKLIIDMAVSDDKVVRATANDILSVMTNSPKAFSSVMSTAKEKTDFLKSPGLEECLKTSSVDITKISEGKTTIYVIIPPDKLPIYSQWLRLVLMSSMRAVIRNKGEKVTVILDEFFSLGYISEFTVALSQYAGYNLFLWAIIQDLNQLKMNYGDSWETIISNSGVQHYFSVKDNFSLDYLERNFGQKSVVTYDDGKPNTTARPLITADEIKRSSKDNIFTIIDQRAPTYFRKKAYYEIDVLKGRYDANPYYKSSTTNNAPAPPNYKPVFAEIN
ncbi:MAG: type IV secretory system conjugative DNA transfer family protein [Ferruginibacter sp.]